MAATYRHTPARAESRSLSRRIIWFTSLIPIMPNWNLMLDLTLASECPIGCIIQKTHRDINKFKTTFH